jgi:lysophospholipase L1-like esterase
MLKDRAGVADMVARQPVKAGDDQRKADQMQNPSTTKNTAWLKIVLSLLDLMFLITLILAPFLWIYDPFRLKLPWGLKPVALMIAPFLFLLARSAIKANYGVAATGCRGLWESGWAKKIALPFAAVFVFFAMLEMVLVVVGFKIDLPPIIFEGKDLVEKKEDPAALIDPELLYRFNPGKQFYGRKINRMGYREREVNPVKKSGTRRVICMGDSITGQGNPGYAQYLHEKLAVDPPTTDPWEAFNVGVYGYSSLQGLRLFQKEVKTLKPDVVTILYGWNDHWLCDVTDSRRMAVKMNSFWGALLLDGLRQKRFYMLLMWAINPGRNNLTSAGQRQYRVPPAEYRATLTQFVKEIRAAGAIPILVTAARRNAMSKKKGSALSPEQANRAHDEYAAITREVAKENQVALVDLAAAFAGSECDHYFARDGMHYDLYPLDRIPPHTPDTRTVQPGLARIANELHAKIKEVMSQGASQK